MQPHTYRKLPYHPLKDFEPVALSTRNYLALVVSPKAPFNSVKELVAYARANPGKLTFASNGDGGFPHMSMEMLRVQGGMFDYLHVPYKGSAQIMTELMSGRADATILGIGSLTPFIKAGRIRMLAVTSPDARGAVSRHAIDRRSAPGLRFARLVRFRRAGRHAEENRRSAQYGDQSRDDDCPT